MPDDETEDLIPNCPPSQRSTDKFDQAPETSDQCNVDESNPELTYQQHLVDGEQPQLDTHQYHGYQMCVSTPAEEPVVTNDHDRKQPVQVARQEQQPSILVTYTKEAHNSRNRKKQVAFKPTVLVKQIKHLKDMPQEEIRTLYINSDEARCIRVECLRLIRQMESTTKQEQRQRQENIPGKPIVTLSTYEEETLLNGCTRGLEKHTAKNNESLVRKRQLLYASVFKIQSLKISTNSMDMPGTIADICMNISKESRDRAQRFGISDAIEAKQAYRSPSLGTDTSLTSNNDGACDSLQFPRSDANDISNTQLLDEFIRWEQI